MLLSLRAWLIVPSCGLCFVVSSAFPGLDELKRESRPTTVSVSGSNSAQPRQQRSNSPCSPASPSTSRRVEMLEMQQVGTDGATSIQLYLRWPPEPVIVAMGHNGDHIRALLYSSYTTITGRGPPKLYLWSSG